MQVAREVGHHDLEPDPSIVEAVGLHHDWLSALADLVDNSIDAGASRVLIRILVDGARIEGLRVIDDGRGMDATTIDAAMTYSRKRDYGSDALGHFGLGLKAASFSQADILNVYSRSASGRAVGRRLERPARLRVVDLDSSDVASILADPAAEMVSRLHETGTVVEWRAIRTFLNSDDEGEQKVWLSQAIEQVRARLGLVYHRIVAAGRVAITVDEYDIGFEMPGAPRRVEAIDPFGYAGAEATVRGLVATCDGTALALDAHVWPANQTASAGYTLAGRAVDGGQGLYVYRADRLIQAGGWCGVIPNSRDLQLARIAVDIDDLVGAHVTINPEKSGVELDAALQAAIASAAVPGGETFRGFLDVARDAAVVARQRARRPVEMVPVDRGLPPEVRQRIEDTVQTVGHDPIAIRWRRLGSDDLVDIDLRQRTLWLNLDYRALLGSRRGEIDDAPLVKTLLLLIYSKFFEGQQIGAYGRQQIDAWADLTRAALVHELQQDIDERDDQR
ncbi:ATP-binding protein [Demequina rhizosphaerae]|uniref:ATP-binding protein n=1 Tax=Demequina rhizosphaerae TaxID=1638985 RepID=UPI0007820E3E|nr:ATP-binding protein [Demequina rhizosphaerae]